MYKIININNNIIKPLFQIINKIVNIYIISICILYILHSLYYIYILYNSMWVLNFGKYIYSALT